MIPALLPDGLEHQMLPLVSDLTPVPGDGCLLWLQRRVVPVTVIESDRKRGLAMIRFEGRYYSGIPHDRLTIMTQGDPS